MKKLRLWTTATISCAHLLRLRGLRTPSACPTPLGTWQAVSLLSAIRSFPTASDFETKKNALNFIWTSILYIDHFVHHSLCFLLWRPSITYLVGWLYASHFSVEFKSSFDKKLRADEIIEWEKLILIDMIAYCVNANVPEGFIPILVHVSFQFLHASLENLDRKHGVVISWIVDIFKWRSCEWPRPYLIDMVHFNVKDLNVHLMKRESLQYLNDII